MDRRLSNKLKWMSFLATWAVVCIHSRTDRWAPGADDWARSAQSAVADLFHFAVPLFFVISGFVEELIGLRVGRNGKICSKGINIARQR